MKKRIFDLDSLEEFIFEHLDLLPTDQVNSTTEAEKRAAKFLYAVGIISVNRKRVSDDMIAVKTQESVLYSQAIKDAEGKNVTEKKINAEVNQDYIRAREVKEKMDNILNYLKTQEKVFENAHIFYRNLYRGE